MKKRKVWIGANGSAEKIVLKKGDGIDLAESRFLASRACEARRASGHQNKVALGVCFRVFCYKVSPGVRLAALQEVGRICMLNVNKAQWVFPLVPGKKTT